jgi:N-acetyltransferase 10
LGFSTHRKKRIKKIKRDKARGLAKNKELDPTMDNFELFLSQSDIDWCYYKDSHRVLGTTVGMLVLQDFEALTPNLMARTMETVEGGGLIIVLLRTVQSLKQLYAMTMDVHARYRTEAAAHVVPRFNERFILSLGKSPNCLVCDDELNVLPLSRMTLNRLNGSTEIVKGDGGEVITHISPEQAELQALQESLKDTPHVGVLVDLTKTLDQAKALLVFLEACSERTSKSTVAMTAARGRGKSAAMGLCLAGAISFGYSTICVTAPEPENLVSVFDFCCRGLKALKYQEHMDYSLTYNTAAGREEIKCITAIYVHRSHRQVIQYVRPTEPDKFASAELVAIDEAAAIPLPVVRALMSQPDRLTFLSSTVNGYEGTGRALSLKLIKELRERNGGRQAGIDAALAAAGAVAGPKTKKGEAKVHEKRWAAAAAAAAEASSNIHGPLREIELATPIRYALGDPVEAWLNKLLCLDSGSSSSMKLVGGAPAPADCELYSVNRDALFSYHKLSEAFLQKLMGLYTSAHYKNSPNDLQMLSDAPAHALFVLLSPSAEQDSDSLPDILAVVQVALEGKISRKAVEAQLARGHRSAGDLIPWTIAQQFGDSNFAQLSGARIVRIAVHPSVQGMGYGSRAVELLYRFYNGEMVSLANADMDSEVEDHVLEEENTSSDDHEFSRTSPGIQGEKLAPRKELPPLLLPLTEVDAPRLDWLGTSFGLTAQLHKFWSRAGMRMLYLRQTMNELTGEHSAIMVRALPKRSGVDDAWLHAFVGDTRRRLVSLFSGPFRPMDVRLTMAVLENLEDVEVSDDSKKVTELRSGTSFEQIDGRELQYVLTPHDLKRLELYGRNLCDHHLVTDLLPVIARLYFTGRLGRDFKLSSLQAALLCGIGLQSRDVDSITSELNLPSNQVLAMFNKAVRKLSLALNSVLEEEEKASLLGGKDRAKVEKAADRMRNVAEKTLDEDAQEAAQVAMSKLNRDSSLPPEIARDDDIMQYAVKGSEEQWSKALDGKDVGDSVQIHSFVETREKRKLDSQDIEREAELQTPKKDGKGTKKKSSKKKRSRES